MYSQQPPLLHWKDVSKAIHKVEIEHHPDQLRSPAETNINHLPTQTPAEQANLSVFIYMLSVYLFIPLMACNMHNYAQPIANNIQQNLA